MSRFSSADCCAYYIKQSQSGRGAVDLPTFKGEPYFRNTGHGWFSSAWNSFIFPHVLSPLVKEFIAPKVKKLFRDRVLPSVRKGLFDVKTDIGRVEKAKESFKKRSRETWDRIKAPQDGGGRGKRRKRSKSL